jgi:hypothetical protein
MNLLGHCGAPTDGHVPDCGSESAAGLFCEPHAASTSSSCDDVEIGDRARTANRRGARQERRRMATRGTRAGRANAPLDPGRINSNEPTSRTCIEPTTLGGQ